MSFSFSKMKSAVSDAKSSIKSKVSSGTQELHAHMHDAEKCSEGTHNSEHRFDSFAPPRKGNKAKWFVDGAGYFWAVSIALEAAKESIWILDWWLSPELYLRRPPAHYPKFRLDRCLKRAAQRGVKVNIIVYKEVTQALTLSSAHTKHHLEGMHENIAVFRHPDHIPGATSFTSLFKSGKGSEQSNESVLYWAHHEKLCLIDGEIAFMGGLDLCYGRWDTNQHSIADVHPTDLDEIVFPGQDYNNARILDFENVDHWKQNKLNRTESSRMGWSDVSLCLAGPSVEDLKRHFTQRWNFIFDVKYGSEQDKRYARIKLRGIGEAGHHRLGKVGEAAEEARTEIYDHVSQELHISKHPGNFDCQIMRSCCKWSHGSELEHSIANAYIEVIKKSEHFIYIENQFFITATSDKQQPVYNKIGAAIVERILRAARAGEKYKIFVVMPSVPAFAGDLRADAALGTRAILEFQYASINRGAGESIMECIAREGFEPTDYIRFYNLRNYDRLNVSLQMKKAEEESGVSYEEARKNKDAEPGKKADTEEEDDDEDEATAKPGKKFQKKARKGKKEETWDSVASCYMLGGEDIRNVPWAEGNVKEIDSFVSEELYVHTKLLIADDRVVICGSANLNDRSQLGLHDSEIAICIEDQDFIESQMDSKPYRVSRFAASLRRHITRKHLGLIPPQDYSSPDDNFQPIDKAGNIYDFNSEEDKKVADPLSDDFVNMWYWHARTNTEAFEKVFNPVPTDLVKTWKEYDEYYEKYFHASEEKGKAAPTNQTIYPFGHVVSEKFADVKQVKEILSRIKGTLVEMPLLFLKDEDMAVENMSFNSLTKEVYT